MGPSRSLECGSPILDSIHWFCLRKVAAHRVLSDSMSTEEQFLVRWNSVADSGAKTVVSQAYLFHNSPCTSVFAHHPMATTLDTSMPGIFATTCRPWLEDHPIASSLQTVWRVCWGQKPIAVSVAIAQNRGFCDFGVVCLQAVLGWLTDQSLSASHMVQVTFLESFLGFHFEVGVSLPVLVRGAMVQWLKPESSSAGTGFWDEPLAHRSDGMGCSQYRKLYTYVTWLPAIIK